MENVKKYFEFSGTISGTNFFLRNLLSSLIGFVGGFIIGYGISISNLGFIGLGLLIVTPATWFSITTLYKRSSAIYPENPTILTVGVCIAQLVGQFSGDGSFGDIIRLILLIVGLVLILKNSNIYDHQG